MIVEMPDHQIINDKSGLALTFDIDDARLYTRTPAKIRTQRWQLTLLGDDYHILNLDVNQVLGLKRPGETGPEICVQDKDEYDRGQRWKLEHMHGYLYKVKNAKSEQYLEVPYGNTDEKTAQVGQWRTADEPHQHWRLVPSLSSQELRRAVEERGLKRLFVRHWKDRKLQVPDASKNDDVVLYIWDGDYKKDLRDRFKFQPVDLNGQSVSAGSRGLWHGYYHILTGHINKTIQVRGGNRDAGTPVVQDGRGAGNTKQWRLVSTSDSDNHYFVVNKNGDGVMEVEDGTHDRGPHIKLGILSHEAKHQQWQVLGVSS